MTERSGPSIGQSDTSENQGRYDWCAKCVAGMVLQGLWIVRLEYMPYPMTWQALGWLLARLTRPSSSGKRMRQRRQNRILSILGLQRTCAGSSATGGRLGSSWNTNFLSQILEAKLQGSGQWRSVLEWHCFAPLGSSVGTLNFPLDGCTFVRYYPICMWIFALRWYLGLCARAWLLGMHIAEWCHFLYNL